MRRLVTPVRAEGLDVAAVRAAEARRQQAVERRAQDLLAPDAEELLGGAVEEHDLLLLVDRDYRIHGRIDDRGKARLRRIEGGAHALRLGLGPLAQRDVAQDHGEQPPPSVGRLRDRRLDRELGPVAAQRPQRGHVAHAAAGDAGASEVLDMAAVGGAEALRDEAFQPAADRLVARAAEELLRGAVEQHDPLRFVDRDDRVHRRVDDGRQPRLARLGALLGDQHLARRHDDADADHHHVGDDDRRRAARAIPCRA